MKTKKENEKDGQECGHKDLQADLLLIRDDNK